MVRIRSGATAVNVAQMIEDQIVDNRLQPGEFIGRRKELVEKFSVAPATLGEAIQLLRSQGLIEAKPGPGGGIFVGEVSPFRVLSAELLDLTEASVTLDDSQRVLDALDWMVLSDAIKFATQRDKQDLKQLALELEAVWETVDRENAIWAIHSRIALITPNQLLKSLYLNIVTFITERYSEENTAPASQLRLETHIQFIEAIVTKDEELGSAAVKAHRKHTMDYITP